MSLIHYTWQYTIAWRSLTCSQAHFVRVAVCGPLIRYALAQGSPSESLVTYVGQWDFDVVVPVVAESMRLSIYLLYFGLRPDISLFGSQCYFQCPTVHSSYVATQAIRRKPAREYPDSMDYIVCKRTDLKRLARFDWRQFGSCIFSFLQKLLLLLFIKTQFALSSGIRPIRI